MAATVFPTASRIVFSLGSGLGGPIILGCSPLLTCWLSIRAPSASCGRPLPSDTTHLTLMCPPSRPSWYRQAPSSTVQAGGGRDVAAASCSLRCARHAASASRLVPPSAFAFPTLQVIVVLRLPVSDQLCAAVLVLRDGLAAHPLNVARGEFDRDAVRVLSSSKLDRPVRQSAACLFRGHSFAPSIHEGILPLPDQPAPRLLSLGVLWRNLVATCPSTTIALLVLLPVAAAIVAPAATRRPEQRQADYSGKAQT